MATIAADGTWRQRWARARRFLSRVGPGAAAPPLPPPLPEGRVVAVPGRGEMFHRHAPGPAGGPTVLLLHGWVISADLNWWRVYDPVSEMARLIAPDHRGHGRGIRTQQRFSLEAAADDAAALLRHLGAGPAVVCGYSMGGSIALTLWRRHPELVSGLVLEATSLDWRARRRDRLLWRIMGLVELLSRLGASEGIAERVLRDAVERSPDLSPYQGWLKGELQRGNAQQFADAGRAMGEFDPSGFAASIDVPTAVVVTTEDKLVPPSKQRALAAAIPGAAIFGLAGDHRACWVQPRRFEAATIAALEWVTARAGSLDAASEAVQVPG